MKREKITEITSWLSPILTFGMSAFLVIIMILTKLSPNFIKDYILIIALTTLVAGFSGIQLDKKSQIYYLKNRFLELGILMLISLIAGLIYTAFPTSEGLGIVSVASLIVGLFYLLTLFLIIRFQK